MRPENEFMIKFQSFIMIWANLDHQNMVSLFSKTAADDKNRHCLAGKEQGTEIPLIPF